VVEIKLRPTRCREILIALQCAQEHLFKEAGERGITPSERLSLLGHRNTLLCLKHDMEHGLEEAEALEIETREETL
jgi:hypothetical protein